MGLTLLSSIQRLFDDALENAQGTCRYKRLDPTRCLEDPSLSGLRIAPIISTCCQSHVLWTFTVQLLVSYPLRPPIVLCFCILCATPGKLPHCLCCQGTHIVVCTCHHVISVWIVPDKDMAQDIAPTHPQCRHSCTAESFSPKVWNQKTRKQIAKICQKKNGAQPIVLYDIVCHPKKITLLRVIPTMTCWVEVVR